jgi:hypothetical protein
LDVEVSLNIHTEVFVVLSLLWFLWPSFNVDAVPLLVGSSVFVPNDDISVLFISVAMDIHNLSFFVDKETVLVSEKLPPS